MLFTNPGTATIKKRILKVDYVCEPGGFVEIPDKVAYVIEAEGTLLIPADKAASQPAQLDDAQAPVDDKKQVKKSSR